MPIRPVSPAEEWLRRNAWNRDRGFDYKLSPKRGFIGEAIGAAATTSLRDAWRNSYIEEEWKLDADLHRERVINAAAEQEMRRANPGWLESQTFEQWMLEAIMRANEDESYERVVGGPNRVSNRPGAVQMFTTRKP